MGDPILKTAAVSDTDSGSNHSESRNYFQKRLRDDGVIKALKKAGAGEGDTVRILDVEFEFVE